MDQTPVEELTDKQVGEELNLHFSGRRRAKTKTRRGPQRGTRAIYDPQWPADHTQHKLPEPGTDKPALGRGTIRAAQENRAQFWTYCRRVALAVRERSKKKGFPCSIDDYFVDELLVQQGFRCALTKIKLLPITKWEGARRHPFGPSLDRIVPSLGYVPGNVRIVAMCVNLAISDWGEDAFHRMAMAYARHHKATRKRNESPTEPENTSSV
jgi:hypothetical protein